MVTTVTAGNLVEAAELHHTHDNKPFVSCRALVNRRLLNDPGEWVNEERPESWPDKETGEKRTRDVVVVDNRFGEVGLSVGDVSARMDRAPRLAQGS